METRVPGGSPTLRKQLVGFVDQLRTLDLKKLPVGERDHRLGQGAGAAWCVHQNSAHEMVKATLNVLLKYEGDIEATLPQPGAFVAKARPRRACSVYKAMRDTLHRRLGGKARCRGWISPAESIDADALAAG